MQPHPFGKRSQVTGRSRVFRVQSVGYFEGGGPVSRIEAIVDIVGPTPKIRSWKELGQLGRGFDSQELMQTVTN